MKHYKRKIYIDENCSDGAKIASRKYYNSSERLYAKRDIKDTLDLSIEEKEIRMIERYDLCRSLDRKFENIRFKLAVTLHSFGIPLWPGGEKTNFDYYWQYLDFECEYDWTHMTEDQLLELLALQTEGSTTVDYSAIKRRYPWM